MVELWKGVDSRHPCRECGVKGELEYRLWKSYHDGSDDYQYHCRSCGKFWWVEGPDA